MRAGSLLVVSLLLSAPSLASEPPDSQLDPRTGLVHTVDSALSGADQVVRYTLDPGKGEPTAIEITSGHDDRSPHLVIDESSVVHVVWQREEAADQIRALTIEADGSPGSERLLSDPGEDCRNPVLALDGSLPWVAYEIHGGSTVAVAVQTITDDPDPIGPRIVIGITTFSGSAGVRLHAVDGHLWATWMDGAEAVAYSAYDPTTEAWSAVAYQDVPDGELESALQRVQADVLRP